MTIKRYGVEAGSGPRPQGPPIASAVEANGWLYVSGEVAMVDGELLSGSITVQARQAIRNLLSVLKEAAKEAGYGPEHVVRCGVWLDDPRDFGMFNAVFGEFQPARSCVASRMAVDCKVEIECVAYKDPQS